MLQTQMREGVKLMETVCTTETERHELCLLMKLEDMNLEMSSQGPRLEGFIAIIINIFPYDRNNE